MSFAKTLSRDEMRNVMAGSSISCTKCCDDYGVCGACKPNRDCSYYGLHNKECADQTECAWVE